MTSQTSQRWEEATAAPPVPRRGAMLAVLCAGMFLVLLDVTVVNVALPGIGQALHTDLPGLQGVVDGYAVTIAGLLLGGGALGDRLGHKRMTLIGFGLFGVASLACGTAPGPEALIAARIVQGAGAALLLPGSLALVTAIYPGRAEQARALGIWAAISSCALPAGPLLGGLLVDGVGWRWIFLVNVPIVAVALAGAAILVHEPPRAEQRRARLDRAGIALAPITLGALVWTVIAAGHGQRATAAGAAAVVLLAGTALVLAERRAIEPMLPAALLRGRAFLGANGIALIMNLVTNGTLFVVTLQLQQIQHHSALAAGAMLVPLALPLAVLAPLSGSLTARYGPHVPIRLGVVIAAIGSLGLLTVSQHASYLMLLPTLLGLGLGTGLITTAVVSSAMRSAPPESAGLAGGFNNTARQAGTALGVAVFGVVAGSTANAEHFTTGVHVLAWASFGLWLAAMALTRVVRAA